MRVGGAVRVQTGGAVCVVLAEMWCGGAGKHLRRDAGARSQTKVAELRSAEGTELDSLVRGLQAQRVSSSAIGKALGLSPQWMSRRYPRPTLLQTRRLKGG